MSNYELVLSYIMTKEIDPRMHTAEHILNQTMIRLLGTERCFSAHIEKKKSKCDYHFDRNLEDDELRKIEEKMNSIIADDLVVEEKHISKTDAEQKFNLSRLPDDNIDKVRIIKIGDYDACPCIGNHAESTRELNIFRIVSSSFENGVLRVRFKLIIA